MEQYQKVSLTSLWNVQGPYDINSIVQLVHRDESAEESSVMTRSIKLVPPPSTNDDDIPACELHLTCDSCTLIRSLAVISDARHVELYDDLDGYCATGKGERQDNAEGDRETEVVSYKAHIAVDSPFPRCRLKFLSLTEKKQLTLVQLTVTTMRTERRSGGVRGSGIDMAKVREIMSTLPQPVPSNVQELMTSVEQYQKNQASVLEEFQQAAATRLSSTLNDPRASLASNMAGIMSVFSKATMLQQETTQTHSTTGGHAVTDQNINDVTTSTNQSQSSLDNAGDLPTDHLQTMNSISKLMSSFNLGSSSVNDGVDRDSGAEPQMLNALRTMCRDVSKMRAADRQTMERHSGSERQINQERSNTSDNTNQSEKSTNSNGMIEVEQRLMGYVAEMEKRIMGRLDRQLEVLQDHVDLRFNKLEMLLNGTRRDRTVDADHDEEVIAVDLD